MKFNVNINIDRFETSLRVVDAHTVGEFCRVVIGGFPEPEGATMMEKKNWMEENYDHIRTALMFEPRGHHDMFGAFLCEPVHEEADFGVLFMDTGGYLSMCGHCTIGAVTVAIEAGLIESHEGENTVVLDTPAGLIPTTAIVKDGKVESVTLTNVPAFVYADNLSIQVDGQTIPFDISFGGNFFAMVDTGKIGIPEINETVIPELTDLGMKILAEVQRNYPVKHPGLDIDKVEEVNFYGKPADSKRADARNVIVFGKAQADRSPCGTGTSARLALLYHNNELAVGTKFINESFIGSKFIGTIKGTTTVGNYNAIIPMITGSCYLTGVADYLIDPTDPLKYGFQVG